MLSKPLIESTLVIELRTIRFSLMLLDDKMIRLNCGRIDDEETQ